MKKMHVELEQLYSQDEENWIKNFKMIKTKSETLSERFAEFMRNQQLDLEKFLSSNFTTIYKPGYKLKKLPLWGIDQGYAVDFEWPTEK